MSEVQPQPGDKVRITYRPRVIHAAVDRDGLYPAMDDVEDGRADVEILEQADLIGTVRGDRYACLDPGKLYGWWDFRMSEWALAAEARKEPVTGAVPGTPAAQAQAEAAGLPGDARLAGKRQPQTIHYGDAEPPHSTVWAPADDTAQVRWQETGWYYTRWPDAGPCDWNKLGSSFFPMREVVGP